MLGSAALLSEERCNGAKQKDRAATLPFVKICALVLLRPKA